MIIPKTNPAEILFNQFCEHYKKRDAKALLSLFTTNVNCWGTAKDEYRVGIKQLEEQLSRDWSQSEQGEIEIVSFVRAPKDATWAAAVCNIKLKINGKDEIFPDFRGTLVIEKENGAWKIAHMHASFPDYRNAENNSFPRV
jgi:hypothetical protein